MYIRYDSGLNLSPSLHYTPDTRFSPMQGDIINFAKLTVLYRLSTLCALISPFVQRYNKTHKQDVIVDKNVNFLLEIPCEKLLLYTLFKKLSYSFRQTCVHGDTF